MPERYEYPPTEFDPKPRHPSNRRNFYFPLLLAFSASSLSLTTSAKNSSPTGCP
jgi:hypothetical protein